MSQKTHYPNGNDFPLKSPCVATVNVYVHDSLMFAFHDYSCPVCRENHAMLDLSSGLMNPCNKCSETYAIIKRKKWHKFFGIGGKK